MKTNGHVTNRELFDQINKLRLEMKTDFDHRLERIEACVDANTDWRNKIIGQLTIMMIVIGAAINWVFAQLSK